MQSDQIMIDSYNEIKRLKKANMGDTVSINYNKLDQETCGELHHAIQTVLLRREKDLGCLIVGAKNIL